MLAIDADWVADQARCLLEDMPVDAFKIGVLGSVENIAAIAEIVSDYPDVPLILDPVLASGRGDELASDDMTHALRELLLPQTTIVTPNSLEVRRLAEAEDDEELTLEQCAARLIETGCEFVLVTGTHENTPQVVNTLYSKARRGALRQLAAPARELPRLRLHARRRRSPRCSPTASSCRKRCAKRRTTRGRRSRKPIGPAWASSCPIACSGRARKRSARRRAGGSACRRCPRQPLRHPRTARRARLRGLYAVTPDLADTARLAALVEAAIAGGAAAIQYRNKSAAPALREAQARALARVCRPRGALLHRQRRRRARRARSMPTACISAKTTAVSRPRARWSAPSC